jgi:hypothetical protein
MDPSMIRSHRDLMGQLMMMMILLIGAIYRREAKVQVWPGPTLVT